MPYRGAMYRRTCGQGSGMGLAGVGYGEVAEERVGEVVEERVVEVVEERVGKVME